MIDFSDRNSIAGSETSTPAGASPTTTAVPPGRSASQAVRIVAPDPTTSNAWSTPPPVIDRISAAASTALASTACVAPRRNAGPSLSGRRSTAMIVAAPARPAAAIRAITGGGADYAFEVVGTAATIRTAWDALRPGGTAVVVGLAPAGVEVSLPAIEFLSEKSIIGSYYGSADPAETFPGLIALIRSGRLELADVVTHLIELDGVEAAFERLRHGEGGRSVVILDPELAGARSS